MAACGNSGGVGGASNAGQATVATGKTVTLTYWTWFPAESTLKKSIAAFEAANPTIKIDLREFSNTDYQKQLPLALNGGQALDVVGVQISAMTNTVRNQLRPVCGWQSNLPADWQSKINGTMVAQTKDIAKDTVLYSVPMGSIGSAVVYSNAEELAKLGLTFPQTLADLTADVAKVKAAHDGVSPIVFTGDSWFQDEMFLTVADQIDPMLSDELYTNKVAWNDPKMVTALTAYQNLYKDGVFDTATLSLKGSAGDNKFNAGKAAFLVEGSWNSSVLSSVLPHGQRDHRRRRHRRGVAGGRGRRPTGGPHLRRGRAGDSEELEVRDAGGEVHRVHDDRGRRCHLGAGPGTGPVTERLHDRPVRADDSGGAAGVRRDPAGDQRPGIRAGRIHHDLHVRRFWTTGCWTSPEAPSRRRVWPPSCSGLGQRTVPGPVTSRLKWLRRARAFTGLRPAGPDPSRPAVNRGGDRRSTRAPRSRDRCDLPRAAAACCTASTTSTPSSSSAR